MPHVTAVELDAVHDFSKHPVESITLVTGMGVLGDAHYGATVQHRSRVAKDPHQPNLRQVHLMHAELIDILSARGFRVAPGVMGENITTRGIDLLALPTGTHLRVGAQAVIEITGLRNPCGQLDHYQAGLMAAVLDRGPDGQLIRLAGVMGVVITGGMVRASDPVSIILPASPHRPLQPV